MSSLIPVVDDFDLNLRDMHGLLIPDKNVVTPPCYFAYELTKRQGMDFSLSVPRDILSDYPGAIELVTRLVYDDGSDGRAMQTAPAESIEFRDNAGHRLDPDKYASRFSVSHRNPRCEGKIHVWHPTKKDGPGAGGRRYPAFRLQILGIAKDPRGAGIKEIAFQTVFSPPFTWQVKPHSASKFATPTLGETLMPVTNYGLDEFIGILNGRPATSGSSRSKRQRLSPSDRDEDMLHSSWRRPSLISLTQAAMQSGDLAAVSESPREEERPSGKLLAGEEDTLSGHKRRRHAGEMAIEDHLGAYEAPGFAYPSDLSSLLFGANAVSDTTVSRFAALALARILQHDPALLAAVRSDVHRVAARDPDMLALVSAVEAECLSESSKTASADTAVEKKDNEEDGRSTPKVPAVAGFDGQEAMQRTLTEAIASSSTPSASLMMPIPSMASLRANSISMTPGSSSEPPLYRAASGTYLPFYSSFGIAKSTSFGLGTTPSEERAKNATK